MPSKSSAENKRAHDLYERLKTKYGDYPLWSLQDIADGLKDFSESDMEARWRVRVRITVSHGSRAHGLFQLLIREHSARDDITQENVLFWIAEGKTDAQARADYMRPAVPPTLAEATDVLTQLQNEFGTCSRIDANHILGYTTRGLQLKLIRCLYRCVLDYPGRMAERARQLRERFEEEFGTEIVLTDKELIEKFDEGLSDDDILELYNAMDTSSGSSE